jgi:hypothetical protein
MTSKGLLWRFSPLFLVPMHLAEVPWPPRLPCAKAARAIGPVLVPRPRPIPSAWVAPRPEPTMILATVVRVFCCACVINPVLHSGQIPADTRQGSTIKSVVPNDEKRHIRHLFHAEIFILYFINSSLPTDPIHFNPKPACPARDAIRQ